MRPFLRFCFIAFLPTLLSGQINISGQLALDSSWHREIYLTLIPGLDDLFKSSEQMIIAKAPLRPDGYFHIEAAVFPERPHLVRLHVSKKGDPEATLIIGGREENHCFLGLDNRRQLQLNVPEDGIFDHFNTKNDPLNAALRQIDSIVHYFLDLEMDYNSISHKNMVRSKQAQTLLAYADSSQLILPALYAIYHADMGNNQIQILEGQRAIYDRLGSHPYLHHLDLLSDGDPRSSFWLVLLLFLLGFVTIYRLRNQKPKSLKLLSQQEKKVLNYLVEGKTNKEIASQLNIEPTTVKSHVYKIYSKLKISSRKEVGSFRKWVKEE